jgi:poly(3-hydroxybutyrate) depolymerase
MRGTGSSTTIFPLGTAVSFLVLAGAATALPVIPALGATGANLTVSGVSSGAAMAIQLHVAHSSLVSGVGAIAGVPYWCSMGNVAIALTSCTSKPDLISVTALAAATNYAAALLSIDSPRHLAAPHQRVYLFSGLDDTIVHPGVVAAAAEYYRHFVSSRDPVIRAQFNVSAEHSFVTDDWGNECDVLSSPFINNCGFDTAGRMLTHLLGPLQPKVAAVPASLGRINQAAHVPGAPAVNPGIYSLGDAAYLYVPAACRAARGCRIHVAFHGCHQTLGEIGEAFVQHAGYLEWAEANGIIVLFPQVTDSAVIPLNPEGCWDWWGYTGEDFATRLAPQILTVMSMIKALQK